MAYLFIALAIVGSYIFIHALNEIGKRDSGKTRFEQQSRQEEIINKTSNVAREDSLPPRVDEVVNRVITIYRMLQNPQIPGTLSAMSIFPFSYVPPNYKATSAGADSFSKRSDAIFLCCSIPDWCTLIPTKKQFIVGNPDMQKVYEYCAEEWKKAFPNIEILLLGVDVNELVKYCLYLGDNETDAWLSLPIILPYGIEPYKEVIIEKVKKGKDAYSVIVQDPLFRQCIEKGRNALTILNSSLCVFRDIPTGFDIIKDPTNTQRLLLKAHIYADIDRSLISNYFKSSSPKEWKERGEICIDEICEHDQSRVDKLLGLVSADYFLEELFREDDEDKDAYYVEYPIIIDIPSSYDREAYPYDIRDLYIREISK